MSSPHPSFENPTLIETVCSIGFQLPEEQPWNQKWFGDFWKKVDDTFPNMVPMQSWHLSARLEQGSMSHQVQAAPSVMRYSNEAGNKLLHLSARNLSLNHLSCYRGWDSFLSEVKVFWGKLEEMASPVKIDSLGLRYINRIERQSEDEPLGDWLDVEAGFYPARMQGESKKFLSQCVVHVEPSGRFTVTIGEEVHKEGINPIMLDLDLSQKSDFTSGWETIDSELRAMHERIWDAFSASITPKLEHLLEQQS